MDEHDDISGLRVMTLKETLNFFMRFPSVLMGPGGIIIAVILTIIAKATNAFGELEGLNGVGYGISCSFASLMLASGIDVVVCFLYQKLFGGESWHR